MKNTLYLIDAMHLIFRAYYAIPEFYNPDKSIMTNAVYGYIRTLINIIKQKQPSYCAAIFDCGPQTFRNNLLPSYKQNRGDAPPELIPQFKFSYQISEAIGVKCYKKKNYEADDLIATLTHFATKRNKRVVIITNDKDLCQLVGPSVSIWNISKNVILRSGDVVNKFSVKPCQIPDFIGLAGDTADNIPGVAGIGPKTASILLKQYSTLEKLYAKLHKQDPCLLPRKDTTMAQLLKHKDMALLSKTIATLIPNVPIHVQLADLRRRKINIKQLSRIYRKLGFAEPKEQDLFL